MVCGFDNIMKGEEGRGKEDYGYVYGGWLEGPVVDLP